MKFHLLPIFLVSLVLVKNAATLPDPEEYWHSVLPNIPMPAVLQELLPTPGRGGKVSFVVNMDEEARDDDSDPERKVKFIFDESYATFKTMPLANKYSTLVYRYNSLKPGTNMTLLFSNSGNKVSFLPRQEADSMPFETSKMQQILQFFSIKPGSPEARMINHTLSRCERPNLPGEDKFCATSLESLIDYNVLKLGKKVRVVSTPHEKRQEYSVLNGVRMIGDRAMVCHREKYAYAVYYCHGFYASEVYEVPLMGADGTRVNAVTLCHKDTSWWNADFFGFKVLGLKPGQPICHFLNSDGLIWYRLSQK